MAEFNAMDTAAFKGVWVFCEQREGQVQAISYQLLSEGRKLANDLGVELCGVVMGSEVNEDYLKALGGYGADRVYYIDSPLLKDYTTDGYAKVLCDLIMEKKPEIMLIGATNLGRDLGPRCAARLHTGLTADCTHLDVDVAKYKDFLRTTSTIDVDNTKFEENTNLKMTRPAFGGHLMATIICPRFRPQMSTVRPGVMQTQPFDEAGAAKVVVEKVTPALTADDIHVEILDIKKSAEKLVDLHEALAVESPCHSRDGRILAANGHKRAAAPELKVIDDVQKIAFGVEHSSRTHLLVAAKRVIDLGSIRIVNWKIFLLCRERMERGETLTVGEIDIRETEPFEEEVEPVVGRNQSRHHGAALTRRVKGAEHQARHIASSPCTPGRRRSAEIT